MTMKTPRQIADAVAFDMQKALVNGHLEGLSIGEQYRRVAAAAIEMDRAQRPYPDPQQAHAFHGDAEPCWRAVTTGDCTENHRYGRTFQEAR